MSDQLVPMDAGQSGGQVQLWEEPRQQLPALKQSPIERPLAAVRRYKWLLVVIVLVAAAGGVLATRWVKPEYEVRASVLIEASGDPMQDRTGPIRSAELLQSDDWIQLLKSFTISDAVVRQLTLYVQPDVADDSVLFRGFSLANRAAFGKYELTLDKSRKRWSLMMQDVTQLQDSGAATDSVGRPMGFLWRLPASALAGTGQQKVRFTVATPRETAVKLVGRLGVKRDETSNFVLLTLDDKSPQLAARIMNTWLAQFIAEAAELKKHKLVEFSNTLEGQLQTAKSSLDSAEGALQSFKVHTITQPSEGAPIAAGLVETQNPVMQKFFDQKIDYDNTVHDIQALQAAIAHAAKDSVPSDAMLQIPSVASGGPATEALRQAFTDYHQAEDNLAKARITFTDAHPTVQAYLATANTLKNEKIPALARQLLASLRARATDDSIRIAGQGENLQAIPPRTIEEQRLTRIRESAANLYTNLQNRYAEAQLAEASATPDVRILDSAIAPLQPTNNTAPRIIFLALVGGIGAALGLAILLDKMDRRVRYPEQATDDLGLPIAGTVPQFPKGGVDQRSPEQMFQLVESFRTLRMSVIQASNGSGVSVAVSSPSPGDGKSLISANLAMSFADAGLRTILVDGDTRRGTLHEMFGLASSPGLTEYLAGSAGLSDVLRSTPHDKLSIIPSGVRQRRSPELLTSPRLAELVAELRTVYDAVIFDTPPLAAGIDGYSIATATGSLLVVLRIGETERRMAAEKLRLFERIPVNIIGAVLNGIELQGQYTYYGYVPGYEAADAEPGTAVVPVP